MWFKIDDGFPTSEPVLRIPRRYRTSVIGLWTLAGAWAAKELTDGYIEAHLLDEFASTPAMAAHLVRSGLWEETENGWKFKGWEKYQPTREQVEADREREAERKRKYRASRRSPDGTPGGLPEGHQAESGLPDPTRPDPYLQKETTSPSRATRLPDSWTPNDEHRKRAVESGVDVEREAVKFRSYAEEKGRSAKSWNAAFTRWLMNAAEYSQRDRVRDLPTADRRMAQGMAVVARLEQQEALDIKAIGQ